MERLYTLIVDKPKQILVVLLVVTGLFAYPALSVRFDSSVDSLLPGNDPERHYYAGVRQVFGSDELGIIGLITDNIYTQEVLHKIRRLTQAIEQVEGVEKVLSLTNAPDPVASSVKQVPLISEIPTTPAALAALQAKLADRPIYLDNLAAADARAAGINIFFANMSDEEFIRLGVDDKIQTLVDAENGPEELYYTGLPHLKVYAATAMWRDLSRFVPLTLVCILAILYVSFRSLRGVFLPAVTVSVTLCWTLGIMGCTGTPLSLGSIALPPLVLVLGTTYSLHVISDYYACARPGRTAAEVVFETLKKSTPPIFITALTTVLGFLSLGVNRIVSIREMGVFAAVGILIAFVLSVVLIPALLCLLHIPPRPEVTAGPGLEHRLRRLGQFDIRSRRGIIIAGCMIAGLSCWQAFSIQVDSNFQAFFHPEDPIRIATDAINQHLAGSMAFYVVIDGPGKGALKQWDTLRRMRDLQRRIDVLPGVRKTVSFVDICEMLDRSAQGRWSHQAVMVPRTGKASTAKQTVKKTTFWENPSQLNDILQRVSKLGPKSFASTFINQDFSRANILVRTELARSSDIRTLIDTIHELRAELFPPEIDVHPTGSLVLLTRSTGDLIAGQIYSLSLAALAIFVVMAIMFLSVRIGFLAMIPNIFPILIFFGLMGAFGATLNLGTSIVASIALGISVDNTIHFMSRLSSDMRHTADQERALVQTLSTVGKPALYATAILFLGFLILGLSTFIPIQEFGMLSAATMVAALAADVILLPALLTTTRIITLWEVLYLKLGRDPHKTIPLFAGLRPLQAKIVILMGQLKSFPQGRPIVTQGDVGNEMFVLINGKAEVVINTAGSARHIETLERGDVFGEMALIRQSQRMADVVATDAVEVFAVDERFLSRIERRYPRIGAKIYRNLSKILSDRLERALKRE